MFHRRETLYTVYPYSGMSVKHGYRALFVHCLKSDRSRHDDNMTLPDVGPAGIARDNRVPPACVPSWQKLATRAPTESCRRNRKNLSPRDVSARRNGGELATSRDVTRPLGRKNTHDRSCGQITWTPR